MVLPRAFARRSALGLVAAIAMTAGRAHAVDCDDPLRSTCINADTYWPHAGPAGRLLTVGAAETVAEKTVGFGLATTYLSRPIVLRVASPGPTGADRYAIDNQVNGTFLWAYGVTNRLELDFLFPVTFIQSGGGTQPITAGAPLQDTAMRDLRFGFAYAFVERARVPVEDKQSVWALVGRFEVSAPTGDRDQFAGERASVFVPSLAADYRRGRWFAGAEIGFRLRRTTELVGARIGSQGMIGLGVGFDVLARDLLSVALEARALPTFAEQANTRQSAQGQVTSEPNGRHITPAEWTLSVRTAPLLDGDLTLQLGGGGSIPFGNDSPITTPRFRFTLGIRYAPLGRPRPSPAPPPEPPPPPEAPVDMTPGAAPGAAPVPAQRPPVSPPAQPSPEAPPATPPAAPSTPPSPSPSTPP
jgi:hypothetical protein